MPELTMGSLFDGIGGFPLAAVRNGIKPLWASENRAVSHRGPRKHTSPTWFMSGISKKLKGADLPPVDIICGGQSVSGLLCCVRDTRRLAGRAFWAVF